MLLVAVSGALGAGLAVGVPALHTWLWGDGSKPAPPPVLNVRFIPLGKTYYPGNKEGHIPTRSASEGPMKSSESRRGSPLVD